MVLTPPLGGSSNESSALRGLGRFRRRLGTEMNEIVPGLFLGSLRDATDEEQLKRNRIKAIVSVHDLTASHPLHESLRVLRLSLSDCPSVDIAKHFSEANDFIHGARLMDENVLVHCLAGVSRSAALVAAYLLTVTDLSYYSAISLVASRRPLINPNFGFRMQLARFSEKHVKRERERLRGAIGSTKFDMQFTADKLAIQAGHTRPRSSSYAGVDSYSNNNAGNGSPGRYGRMKGPSLSILQQHRLRRSLTQGQAPVPRGDHQKGLIQSIGDMMGRFSFIDD